VAVTEVFEKLGVPYAVVGSMASSYYGEPRFTNDVDIIASLSLAHVADFLKAFPPEDYYVSEEAVRQAIAGEGQFNIILPEWGLKADIIITSDSPFDASQIKRRIREKPAGAPFDPYFATPEDVILKKLDYYREGGSEKHLRDIAGILKLMGDRIDRTYIEHWA